MAICQTQPSPSAAQIATPIFLKDKSMQVIVDPGFRKNYPQKRPLKTFEKMPNYTLFMRYNQFGIKIPLTDVGKVNKDYFITDEIIGGIILWLNGPFNQMTIEPITKTNQHNYGSLLRSFERIILSND